MSESIHPSTDNNLQQFEKTNSTILPLWLIKLCKPSRMLWLGPLLGFVLCIPFLFTGYKCDDHVFLQNTLDKSAYHHRPAWDYFNWVSSDDETAVYREKGILVSWWTPDAFRFHMFRPIASLVHAFEFRYFGDYPWVMHLGLALLYALLIYLCTKLLMRFSLSAAALGIAVLLFAIDDTHAYVSCWISSYNTMLCCIFGLFAFLMHDRWRSRESVAGLFLSIASFLVALLCSEGGIALMGYLLAYVIFIESGSWLKRITTLIPSSFIAIGYLVFYSIQGFGAKISFGYLSPSDDPLNTIFIVLSNTVLLALSQLLSFPPLTVVLTFAGLEGVIIAALLLSILVFVFRKVVISNRRVAFFGTGMVLTIIPFTLGLASDRLLLWAGFGAAGLLGELFTIHIDAIGKLQRVFSRTLLVTNIAVSLICFIPLALLFINFESGAKMLEKKITSENTVILNNSGAFSSLWSPAIRYEKKGVWPEHCYSLYDGMDSLTIKRTGDRTLLAETPKGWFASYLEQSTRPKQLYFNKGDTINLQLMTATFEKVTSDGRPVSVSFYFKKDLTEFAWLKWTKNGPERCKVPAIGEEMRLFAPLF